MVVAMIWGRTKWAVLFSGYKVSLKQDESVLESI